MPQFVQVVLLWVLKSVVFLILLSLFYKWILVLFLIQRMTLKLWECGKIPDLPKYQSPLCPWKQFNSVIVFVKPMLDKCVCSPEHHATLGLALAVDSISVDKLESPITYGLSQGRSSVGRGQYFSSPTSFICGLVLMAEWGLGMSHVRYDGRRSSEQKQPPRVTGDITFSAATATG